MNRRKVNFMYDFTNPKYEDLIKWINNHKAHGDTWEQIKYACKENVEELRKFLKNNAKFMKNVAARSLNLA